MRIHCPFCGERDLSEFIYHGDATAVRPDPNTPDAAERFFQAVYLRDNPAGPHEELWYHGFGCHSWLRVHRDTQTHEILGTSLTKDDHLKTASNSAAAQSAAGEP